MKTRFWLQCHHTTQGSKARWTGLYPWCHPSLHRAQQSCSVSSRSQVTMSQTGSAWDSTALTSGHLLSPIRCVTYSHWLQRAISEPESPRSVYEFVKPKSPVRCHGWRAHKEETSQRNSPSIQASQKKNVLLKKFSLKKVKVVSFDAVIELQSSQFNNNCLPASNWITDCRKG